MSERTCEWSIDDADDDSVYETQCGQSFQFTTDGVEANGFRYCCYCGARLIEVRTSAE
jgi:predicted SprT family Zn-dependent metalloprotease